MVKRWMWTLGLVAALLAPARMASADLFSEVFGKRSGEKKKAEAKASAASSYKFKFSVHLTTGDVLRGIEYKGGSTKKSGSFRFVSNFESDIDVKTSFIKYVDMDMIGDQVLEEEYTQSKADRVYPRNQDVLTGKIVGFSAKDVLITTTYGDVKVYITQVRYVMFRNPSAAASTEMPASTPVPVEESK